MQGQSVFRWAVWGMAPVAQKALDLAGITAEDLDAFIPHQANVRIIDAMAKQLRLPADLPIARDIAQTGNTSAASIPLATERMLREGAAPRGGLALQIGFGAGLVYAAQVVVLPDRPDRLATEPRTPVGPRVPRAKHHHHRWASATDADPTDEGAHHHGC